MSQLSELRSCSGERERAGLKIGFLYIENEVSNVVYRALIPAAALAERGHEVVKVVQRSNGRFALDQLHDCDVVHIYRRIDQFVERAVDELTSRGVAVTWDNDDDLRSHPKESPRYREVGGARGEREFRGQVKMMRRVQVATTTNERLADRWRAADVGKVVAIENYLESGHYVRGRRAKGVVTIGWCGAGEHRADSTRLGVAQMLQRVMARNDDVRVATIGVKLDLDGSRYSHHPSVPFHNLAEALSHWDIGIAPVADIPNTYARSNVKVKEYSAAGVPWVASARGPYDGMGASQGGMLARDDEWEEKLVALAGSRLRRARLRLAARAWSVTQHINRNVEQWEAVFDEATSQHHAMV